MRKTQTLSRSGRSVCAYTAYGAAVRMSWVTVIGFAGEFIDPTTGCYLLGRGYRLYNPILMRFQSPDQLSPFGTGGRSHYAYCLGDPINFVDPNGRTSSRNTTRTFNVVDQLSTRQIHGDRVIFPIADVPAREMTAYIHRFRNEARPAVYRHLTKAAVTHTELHPGDPAVKGVLQVDAKFLEDTVTTYARQESIHLERGRGPQASESAARKQQAVQYFLQISESRIQFLQGQGNLHPGDPAFREITNTIIGIRL